MPVVALVGLTFVVDQIIEERKRAQQQQKEPNWRRG